MAAFKVFYKAMWHDKEVWNSYYIVSAATKAEARTKARKRAHDEHAPTPKAKLSVTTSFTGFVK